MHLVRFTLTLVLCGATGSVAAQAPLAAAVEGRGSLAGAAIATLSAGTRVLAGVAKGGESLVTVEGWVDASRLGGKRDSFPASVGGKAGLRLRDAPSLNGAILGELRPGTGLTTLGQQGTWMRVKRSLWVPTSALAGASKSAASKPAVAANGAAATTAGTEVAQPPPAGSIMTSRGTALRTSPVGKVMGNLPAGVIAEPLARDRGWVRVRIEGWVAERDVVPADSSFGASLTAADLRADPEGTRGKMVRWEVQVLSLQVADPLRRELTPDEPYLLARGPGTESALLYLAVPPSMLSEVKTIPPLTNVLITARVRSGRSAPVGTPILDLKSIARR
jgi:hypothetical protein